MKYKTILALLITVSVLVASGVWLAASLPAAQISETTRTTAPASPKQVPQPAAPVTTAATPIVGTVTATPSIITVNTPTQVTISVEITDSTLLPNGANLLRLGAAGTQPIILGVMHDDGLNGDTVAGDKVFSLRGTFNETTAGQVSLKVSAAFKGLLMRIPSSTITVQVWKVHNTALGVTVAYPPQWQTTSLRPNTDPTGLNGIQIGDPTTEFSSDGIALTIARATSVAAVASMLHIEVLRNQYTQHLGTRDWLVSIYDSTTTHLPIIVSLAQNGPDVIRLGGDYSTSTLKIMTGIMASIH